LDQWTSGSYTNATKSFDVEAIPVTQDTRDSGNLFTDRYGTTLVNLLGYSVDKPAFFVGQNNSDPRAA
jgi:hypothetical protein